MHARMKGLKKLLKEKLWTLPFILTFLLGCSINASVTTIGFAITGAIFIASSVCTYLVAHFIKKSTGKR
jgi:uncharacterized membrane-anchored protein